jgi:hypothetical protein
MILAPVPLTETQAAPGESLAMLTLSVTGPWGQAAFSRRAFLRATLQTAGALGLPGLLGRRAEAARAGRPGGETAVIQLWLGGGPSHLDTYDLKPAAPAEIRGPFRPIATNVPGLGICELLPLQARRMDRLALIRSLHHTTDEHPAGAHWTQTGYFAALGADANGKPTHPAAGAVTARLRGPNRPGVPPYVHVAPDPMGFPVFLRVHDAAFLGARYNPLRVESARKRADPNRATLDDLIGRPQFSLPPLELFPGVSADRLALPLTGIPADPEMHDGPTGERDDGPDAGDGKPRARLLVVDLRIGFLVFRGVGHGDRRAIKQIDASPLPQPAGVGLGV